MTNHEPTPALTNRTASTRLRTLLAQLTQEPPPPLSTRLIKRLTPTPEEEPHHNKEAAA